jgi:heparin binding hemagglutinin HbhA
MSIATDVRAYADAALEQGKTALTQATATVTTVNKRFVEDAPKPAFAALGVADLVAETVTKRVEALPAEAVANVSKVQETSKAAIAKAQADALAKVAELRGKFDARVDAAKGLRNVDVQAKAKDAAEGYVAIAKNLYNSLTERGEAKVAELRKDPRLVKFLGEFSDAAETVTDKVESVVETVKSANPVGRPAAPKPAARKAPAAKTAATKAPASKPAARKAPAKKAAPSA